MTEMLAAASADAHDAHGERADKASPNAPQKRVEKNVKDERDQTHDAAHNVIAPSARDRANPNVEPGGGFIEEWGRDIAKPWKEKPLPKPPGLSPMVKGAALATTIILPPTGIVVAAGYAAVKAWQGLRRFRPFRWIDNGVSKGASAVAEGARSVGKIASYPFRLAGRLGVNTLRSATTLVAKPVAEIINDLEIHINRILYGGKEKTEEGKEKKEHVNLISSTLGTILHKVFIDLPVDVAKHVLSHPLRYMIATGVGVGVLANANWDLVLASQNIVQGIGDFFQWLTSAAKVAPAGAGASAAGSSWWHYLPFVK